MVSASFRFDAVDHVYTDPVTGRPFEHITGLLTVAGWSNERWYTEESSARGRLVHELTARLDLGALRTLDIPVGYAGYVDAYRACCALIRRRWLHVETPAVHRTLRFAGCPDRVGTVFDAAAVLEIKSGAPEPGHAIQTALQAILVEEECQLPGEVIARYACYVTDRGRYRLEQHIDRRDFVEARRLIARYCR